MIAPCPIRATSGLAWGWMLLMAAALSGCATRYEGKYAHEDGWREAVIQKIGGASDIATPQFSDCRDNLSAQQLAATRFALVAYRRMGRTQRNVVPLLPNDPSTAGQAVYMNVADCNAPLVARP
jgi:hypothetical protein